MGDSGADAPISRLANWAGWNDGPRTPSGFLALFDLGELVFGGVLLLALILLILFLLSPREADAPMWRRMSAKVGALRFRMGTALALIALIAIYLGCEVHSWRAWGKRSEYKRGADQNSKGVESALATLRSLREERAHIDRSERMDDSARRMFYRSRTAAARGIAVSELKKQEVDAMLVKLVVSTAWKRNNERAAANPLNPVASEPGEPFPQTEKEAADWLRLPDYRRALALYDELARLYPQLVEAHSRSAWLRATCPDAHYRNGKLAVQSARRACELTLWRNPDELEVLAAACAEAGDFESAVKWQEKASKLTVDPPAIESCQKRLALYREGKPFRQQ